MLFMLLHASLYGYRTYRRSLPRNGIFGVFSHALSARARDGAAAEPNRPQQASLRRGATGAPTPQREIASRRSLVVRGPIDAITTITATMALAMNKKTPIVP